MMKMSKKKGMGFIFGLGLGAGIGMLLAPKKGEELRRDLSKKISELLDKAKNISLSVISKALGHNCETTTQIYLRSIQSSEVDDANAEILALL